MGSVLYHTDPPIGLNDFIFQLLEMLLVDMQLSYLSSYFTQVKRATSPQVMSPLQDSQHPMTGQCGDRKVGLLHQLGTCLRGHPSFRAHCLAEPFV